MPERKTIGSRHSMSRRHLLVAAATITAAPMAAMAQTDVSPHYTAARATLLAGRSVSTGRVVLDIPRLAESGNSVPLKATVESPMTESDHVRTLHVLSEQNPIASIARFHLGPRAGRAEVATNIRLATTQNVHVLAEMSDGSLWEASTEVVVLIAACLDGT